MPERCPLAPEDALHAEEIRELFYGKLPGRYRILFTVRHESVHVLHIRHGARDTLRPPTEPPA
jgi:plasmid stabilization system protein ParE